MEVFPSVSLSVCPGYKGQTRSVFQHVLLQLFVLEGLWTFVQLLQHHLMKKAFRESERRLSHCLQSWEAASTRKTKKHHSLWPCTSVCD